METYLDVLERYADFNGRARRKEYWTFYFYNVIISTSVVLLDIFLFGGTGVLTFIYMAAILVPSAAVTARRLHDIGKSGWMWLVNLIPFIGGIWFLVLTLTEGDQGPNQYGLDPKEHEYLEA